MTRLRSIALTGIWIAFPFVASGQSNCDANLALGDLDPLHGAAALDLCDVATGDEPGVVDATYGAIDFATDFDQLASSGLGVGLLADFGTSVEPLFGARMLGLSSGTARDAGDPGYSAGLDKGYSGSFPSGLPYEFAACPVTVGEVPHDSAALRLTLRAPSSAQSFSFRSKFHTADYPNFLCSAYNDWFVALLDPAPPSGANVVFDGAGNPITVNSQELLTVCASESVPTGYTCSEAAELDGTGFEASAATPWLFTRVPVTPGSVVTLTFGIWDAGDGSLDSTVLLDDFRWSSRTVESPVTSVPEPSAMALSGAALAALVARRRIAEIR